MIKWWLLAPVRWLLRRCMDCGVELGHNYIRGEACDSHGHNGPTATIKRWWKTMNGPTAFVRWLFRRCMDCGVKLDKTYNRGDVCQTCFNNFNGATIDELLN